MSMIDKPNQTTRIIDGDIDEIVATQAYVHLERLNSGQIMVKINDDLLIFHSETPITIVENG